MDLQLYLRVFWRFRLLVVLGLLLALMLAFLSYARVDFSKGLSPTFSYREQQKWQSFGLLQITARGFPEGNTEADPNQFAGQAVLYSELAKGDAVGDRVSSGEPAGSSVDWFPAQATSTGTPLPLIHVVGYARTPQEAIRLAQRATNALIDYIASEQIANRTPERDRVLVKAISEPKDASLNAGRAKTRPIVIFLSVMITVIALAFILENLRPRSRATLRSIDARPARGAETHRRSA